MSEVEDGGVERKEEVQPRCEGGVLNNIPLGDVEGGMLPTEKRA